MQDLIQLCLKDFGQCLSDPRLSGLDSLITIIFVVIPVIGGLVNKLMNINFWKFVLVTGILFLLYSATQRDEYLLVTNQPDIQMGQYTSASDKYFNLHWGPACPNSPEPVVELLKAPEDECSNYTVETWDLDYLAERLREIGLLNPNERIQPSVDVGRPQNESIEIRDQNDRRTGYINIQRNPLEEFGSVWRQQRDTTIPVSNKYRLTWEYKWEYLP